METNTQIAAPTNFMFGTSEVRTVYRGEDEFFFVASDVSRILGYDDTNRMTRMLDEEDVIFDSITAKHLNQYGEFDREVEVSLITESGLYQCIFNSKREEAKAFTRWVTKEVLPQIRKYGTYTLGQEVATLRLQLADKDAEIAKKEVQLANKDTCIVEFMRRNAHLTDSLYAFEKDPTFRKYETKMKYAVSHIKKAKEELGDSADVLAEKVFGLRDTFVDYNAAVYRLTMLRSLRGADLRSVTKQCIDLGALITWRINDLMTAMEKIPNKTVRITDADRILVSPHDNA